MTALYDAILATVPRHHVVTVDTLRDAIDAAQLTTFERGEIFRHGVRMGYLQALPTWVPSTHAPAKHRAVRQYRRTAKPVRPGVAA